MSPSAESVRVPVVSVKGPARRQKLVEATVRILVRGGVGEVSHRTVSDEAGLPMTATTYYFATLDALLAETFRALFESFISRPSSGAAARRLAEDPVAAIVDGFFEVLERRESTSRVLWELLLAASRRPDMKGYPLIYWAAEVDLVAQQLSVSEECARAVVALLDGYILTFLTTRYIPPRHQVLAAVTGVVSLETAEPAGHRASPAQS